MGTINRKFTRYDFTPVYTHPKAEFDIAMVHGLNGHPEKTWTASNKVYWPTDLLPKTLEGNGVHANVLVFGYNADVLSGKDKHPSLDSLQQHGENMMTKLGSLRRDSGRQRVPIVWVVHSLGGLVLKSALLHADRCRDPSLQHIRSVFVSTFGIAFLGTPHEGSSLAKWGEVVRAVVEFTAPKRVFESHSILLKTLNPDSEALKTVNTEFINIMQKFEVLLVYEEETTSIGLTRRAVVDQKSAAPVWSAKAQKLGIEANHSDMCKFSSTDAPGYRSLSSTIVAWTKRAPAFITARWHTEDENRRIQAEAAVRETILFRSEELAVSQTDTAFSNDRQQSAPPSPIPMLQMSTSNHSTLPSLISGLQSLKAPPFFYHPEVFRPNSYHVGRDEQLVELHRILQDPERRKDGTSAVLVRARTGGGKTHLARRYVFDHRDDYSGGIFWLPAYSIGELELELLRLWQLIGPDRPSNEESYNDVLRNVRYWFNSRQNWLIILDGIMSDEGIERFVPDAANTSLIYTSTSPSFTGNHHYDNPKLLELPPLDIEDARMLLLEEMEYKKPRSREDLRQAAEVVKLVEKLPLMIHVLAQQLKETREPLSAFLKRYKNKPSIHRKIQPFDFVLDRLDERGANAALNVLYVLAFFDQYVPVELLALGLRALAPLPWKTGEAGSHERATLNNTLRVLIAFALVERSDSHEMSPTSSRTSKRSMSLERSAPLMDTLKVYPLVQRYVVEYMQIQGKQRGEFQGQQREHILWLQRAIDVFCRSLREADVKIKDNNPKVGLPVDYHRYRLHGRRILKFIRQYESSTMELIPWRETMEERLRYVEERFQELQGLQDHDREPPRISVFDRANGLSDSDSGTLSSQTNSQEAITPPTGEQPQYRYLYPAQGYFSPPYPVEDEQAVDEDDGTTPKQEYKDLGRHKRTQSHSATLKSMWGPAEVSVSREYASVSSFHATTRRLSRGSVSGSSVAETSLLHVRQRSSRSPSRSGGVVQSRGRAASLGSRSTATDFVVETGGVHYGLPTPGGSMCPDERPTELSLGPPAAASRRSSFLNKFKENLPYPFKRKTSAASTTRPILKAPTSAQSSPGVRQTVEMPMIPSLSDCSVGYSPGQLAAPSIPFEKSSTPGFRYPLAPGLHQQYTEPYQPSLPRVDSSSLDPMAMSFPSPQLNPRRSDAFIPSGVIGATPMSRESSGQSSNASRGWHADDRGRRTFTPHDSGDDAQRAVSPFSSRMSPSVSTSRPLDLALDGQSSRSPLKLVKANLHADSRYAETMGPSDLSLPARCESMSHSIIAGASSTVTMPGPSTHARVGSDHSNTVAGPPNNAFVVEAPGPRLRSRRGSSASNLGQQVAIMPPMPPPPVTFAHADRQSHYRRAIGAMRRGRGRGRGRTQSESPSAESRMHAPGFLSTRGSPEPVSEPMSRGGSGGIVVGSGYNQTIVPFGDVTAENLNVASRRLRQQHIDHRPPPGIPLRRSSASSGRGSFQNQISPSSMSRGNSGSAGAGLGISPAGKMEQNK